MEQVLYILTTVLLVSFFVLLYLSTSRAGPDRISFWANIFLLAVCSSACFGAILGAFVTAVLLKLVVGVPLYFGYMAGGLLFGLIASFGWWKATRP